MPNTRDEKKWKYAVFVLCAVGLLKGFRPSGRALVDYAVDYHNFTVDQMIHEVLPAITPALVISVLILLFITDALNYKPVIVLGALCSVGGWIIINWFYDSVMIARARQWIHGLSIAATELAYFTYTYALIEKSDYKRVTSYTHSAVMLGQFLSGIASHILITQKILNLPQLNYVSLGAALATLLFTFLLPKIFDAIPPPKETQVYTLNKPVQKNQVMYSTPTSTHDDNKNALQTPSDAWYLKYRNRKDPPPQKPFFQKMKESPSQSRINFIHAYSNMDVLKWSIWYAFEFGLYLQVDTYIQVLWREIGKGSGQQSWHGVVYATSSIVSMVLGLLVGCLGDRVVDIRKRSSAILGGGAVVQGVVLLLMAKTGDLYWAYGYFVVFRTVFQVLAILTKFMVAEKIRERSEAFIFGINGLGACIIYALLTLTISSRFGLKLRIREQTSFLGGYALILGGSLFLVGFITWGKNGGFGRVKSWVDRHRGGRSDDGVHEMT